jgi:hypothetical protein
LSDDTRSDDPVSWLLIRPGWKVVALDGPEIGAVDEVIGDDSADIFDGLAVAMRAFGKPRYVPAEQVGQLTESVVRLTITHAQAEKLGEFREPEGNALAPIARDVQSMNIWRRIAFFFRRMR